MQDDLDDLVDRIRREMDAAFAHMRRPLEVPGIPPVRPQADQPPEPEARQDEAA